MTDSWLPGSYITYAALTLGNVIRFPLLSFLSGSELRDKEVGGREEGRSSTSSDKDKLLFGPESI